MTPTEVHVKKLIAILFLTLVGTMAKAAPDSKPLEFADDHCMFADDSDACRTAIKNDPSTQMMNHYSLAIRVCSKQNISFAPNRSKCFALAAKEMRDSDFRTDVTDCRNDQAFWSNGPKNETWEKVADCQNGVFAKRAAAVDRKSASGGPGHGAGTRP